MYGIFNFLPEPEDYQSLDLGPAPTEEQCPCPGFPRYEDKVHPILDRWLELLEEFFSDHREYGFFSKEKTDSKYGPEWSVVFKYKKSSKYGQQYANHIQANLPNKWEPDIAEILFFPEAEEAAQKLVDSIEEWITGKDTNFKHPFGGPNNIHDISGS